MNLQEISLGRHAPSIVNVVIEASKNSQEKYHFHAKSGRFKLAYKFSVPVPTEYGWIPETIAEDGHFLNAMVIGREPTHPGYICEARPIGMLKRKDNDHHIICVLLGDEEYASIQDIADLNINWIRKIVAFFEPYFELSGWLTRIEAIEAIKSAHGKYRTRRRRPHTARGRRNKPALSSSINSRTPQADFGDDRERVDAPYPAEEEDAHPNN
ncbi:MAG: inorganic diphosphatase [Candidatus Poribacteria bacterium]|nr:inorganic diphosphatase [Candidatus Poribacteria bacterium]